MLGNASVFSMPSVNRLVATIGLTIALSLGACTTTGDVVNAPLNEGQVVEIPAKYQETVSATLDALRNMGISVKNTESRPEGVVALIGEHMNIVSWGQVGRVFVEKSEAPPTTLHVIWEKRATYQIAGSSTENFSRKLESAIKKVLAQN